MPHPAPAPAVKQVRIAVIGCGFYAQNHLHAWRELSAKGAKLVGVCDLDSDKASRAGSQFDVPWFNDAKAMLDAVQPDAVDIVTQMGSHRTLAEMVTSRAIGAIVQKPFAPTWEDCVSIVEHARRHKAFLAVHENFRFATSMRRLAQVIASGAIGKPNWARLSFRTHFDVYATQPYFYTEERLAILDVGIHILDLARVFMGEVRHLTCETQRRNPKVKAEDTATMLLRHESGAVSVVECTYDARKIPDPFPETLVEIEGDGGSIVVGPGEKMRVTSQGLYWDEDIGSPLLGWTSRPWHVSQAAVLDTNAHMLECLQTGVPARTSGEDNLKTYALVEAAYQSAASGMPVQPKVHNLPSGGNI